MSSGTSSCTQLHCNLRDWQVMHAWHATKTASAPWCVTTGTGYYLPPEEVPCWDTWPCVYVRHPSFNSTTKQHQATALLSLPAQHHPQQAVGSARCLEGRAAGTSTDVILRAVLGYRLESSVACLGTSCARVCKGRWHCATYLRLI